MTARNLARGGALAGVLSVIVTFVGPGIHGGLPDTVTEAGVRSYIASANAVQTGIGNFVELFGNLLFLVFAAFLYRASCARLMLRVVPGPRSPR